MQTIERALLSGVVGGMSSPMIEPQPGGGSREVANPNPSQAPASGGGNPYALGGQMPSGGKFNSTDVYPGR